MILRLYQKFVPQTLFAGNVELLLMLIRCCVRLGLKKNHLTLPVS